MIVWMLMFLCNDKLGPSCKDFPTPAEYSTRAACNAALIKVPAAQKTQASCVLTKR